MKKKIFVKAQIHGTYIVGEDDSGMYLIDQHAAQERILLRQDSPPQAGRFSDIIPPPPQCDPAWRALLCYKNIMEWFPIA